MTQTCPHCQRDNKIAGRSIGEAPHHKPIPSVCAFCRKPLHADKAGRDAAKDKAK